MPADVTDRSPQRRAAGVRAQQQTAVQPAAAERRGRLPGEPATVDSRTRSSTPMARECAGVGGPGDAAVEAVSVGGFPENSE